MFLYVYCSIHWDITDFLNQPTLPTLIAPNYRDITYFFPCNQLQPHTVGFSNKRANPPYQPCHYLWQLQPQIHIHFELSNKTQKFAQLNNICDELKFYLGPLGISPLPAIETFVMAPGSSWCNWENSVVMQFTGNVTCSYDWNVSRLWKQYPNINSAAKLFSTILT